MTILFDIKHIAHINFFKVVIKQLVDEGHDVLITYIDRGRLPDIIKKEFPSIKSYSIGKHRGTFFSIIFEANILKAFNAYKFIKEHSVDIMLGVDAFVTGFACKLSGIPNIQFYDDPERKVNFMLEKLTSDALFYPNIVDFNSSYVQTYNALKEWAYLSPEYFKPDESVLEEYGVSKKEYLFVREVATGSLNYKNQETNLVSLIANDFPTDKKVLLSLEDKSQRHKYPDDWILLQEPLIDIHSLIYFSSTIVSSGDSMAREGAMLGIPSFYVGFRDMSANRFIESEGLFFRLSTTNFSDGYKRLSTSSINQSEYRNRLKDKWIDVTNLIHDAIFQNL